MPPLVSAALDPGDRKLLYAMGGVFLLLMAVTVILPPPPEKSAEGTPSSYSSAAGGARASYLLLKELNYTVERWEQSPVELPQEANGVLLILAQPEFNFAADEVHAVHEFLRRGGTVLATGLHATSVLPGADAEATVPFENEWRKFSPRVASPLTKGEPEIELRAGVHWRGRNPAHVVLYGRDDQGMVVTYRVGEGRVIWWATPTPLTNAGISSSGNLALFLNAAGRPGEHRILWDEYSHGRRGTLWSYMASTPVPWGALQIGLVALAVLFTFGRRSGPIRPQVKASRLNALEFVETLGGLYHRAHAAPSAVSVASHRFRYLLARRLGMPAAASSEELARAAGERLGKEAAQLGETLRLAEQAAGRPKLADSEALRLVQALDRYAERLTLKHAASSVTASSSRSAAPKLKETR